MHKGKSLIEVLNSMNEHFLILLFIATILVGFLQILFRTFLSIALPWAEEISRYLFVYFIFGGAALAFKKGLFVCVAVVSKFIPKKLQFFMSLIIDVIVLLFFLIVSYIGIDLFLGASGQLTPALEIEIRYAYLAIPIFFIQMSFYAVNKIISLCRKKNE